MEFSDLTLVMQIVLAVISAWFTVVAVIIWAVNVYEARRRPSRWRRAGETFASIGFLWLLAEGYIAALARWFTIRNDITPLSLLELVWALVPGLNILYGWTWLVDILAFNGRFLGALFGFPP